MENRRAVKAHWLISPLVVAVLSLTFAVAPRMAGSDGAVNTPAELWHSWTPESRANYVWGYLSGFQEGKRAGCSFYADKVMPGGPHKPTPPERLPRQACLNALPDFKSPYFQEYVDAITSYYAKYPKDRESGLSQILSELATPPGLTIDEIHTKLNGHPSE